MAHFLPRKNKYFLIFFLFFGAEILCVRTDLCVSQQSAMIVLLILFPPSFLMPPLGRTAGRASAMRCVVYLFVREEARVL